MTPEYWKQLHEDMRADIKTIKEDVSKIKIEIAVLKVKSGIWGATAGVITILAFILSQKLL